MATLKHEHLTTLTLTVAFDAMTTIGKTPAEPTPGRDTGQDHADDRCVGLERDAHVGGEKAARQNLQDEDGRRREERQRASEGGVHRGFSFRR